MKEDRCRVASYENDTFDFHCLLKEQLKNADTKTLNSTGYAVYKQDAHYPDNLELAFCDQAWTEKNMQDKGWVCCNTDSAVSECSLLDTLPMTCVKTDNCRWDDTHRKCRQSEIFNKVHLLGCKDKVSLEAGHELPRKNVSWSTGDLKLLTVEKEKGDAMYWCSEDQWRPACGDKLVCTGESYVWK